MIKNKYLKETKENTKAYVLGKVQTEYGAHPQALIKYLSKRQTTT